MAAGGTGGLPSGTDIMISTEKHEGSIRSMHYADWDDADFQRVVDALSKFDDTGEIPDPPEYDDEPESPEESGALQLVIQRSHALFDALCRDDQIVALNELAIRLGVMDPDDAEG